MAMRLNGILYPGRVPLALAKALDDVADTNRRVRLVYGVDHHPGVVRYGTPDPDAVGVMGYIRREQDPNGTMLLRLYPRKDSTQGRYVAFPRLIGLIDTQEGKWLYRMPSLKIPETEINQQLRADGTLYKVRANYGWGWDTVYTTHNKYSAVRRARFVRFEKHTP